MSAVDGRKLSYRRLPVVCGRLQNFQACRMDVGIIRWCDEVDTVAVKRCTKGGRYTTLGERSPGGAMIEWYWKGEHSRSIRNTKRQQGGSIHTYLSPPKVGGKVQQNRGRGSLERLCCFLERETL